MNAAPCEETLRLLRMLPEPTRREMVRMYRTMLTVQVGELDTALAQGHAQAQDLAHRIAGSAGMMQDLALSAQTRAIEAALRDGRRDEALACRTAVRRCADESLAALEAAFPSH